MDSSLLKHKMWVSVPVQGGVESVEQAQDCIIPEYLRNKIRNCGWGDLVAFESAETGEKRTFNQVLDNSRKFAAGLIKLGSQMNLKRTDVVSVILVNTPEYASLYGGIWEAGLCANPVNPFFTKDEISNQLEASGTKVIITSPDLLPMVREIQEVNKNITKIILFDPSYENTEAHEDCFNYIDMLNTDTDGVDFFTGSQLTNENDVAVLLYSSGTTGLPKGVMVKHSGLLKQILFCTHPEVCKIRIYDGNNEQERLIGVLPFFYIYGISCNLFMSMLQGAHVMTMTTFKPLSFIDALRRHRPTVMFLVPTLVSFICNSDQIGFEELQYLHSIYCGTAVSGESLIKRFQNKAKNAQYLELYGLTEVSCLGCLSRFEKIGSVGQPLPEVLMKIINPTNDEELGQGERGEVCIKTPCIMKGYLNNEKATRETIDEDGWLHTGDVGYYDEDGCFYIVDRIKDLIKVKGFQVAPAELEDVIRSHEKVAEVGVVGIPDKICGEVPRAFIVPVGGEEVDEDEILSFVSSKVTSYKQLKGGVQIVSDIPKGCSGKILRRVLRNSYLAQVV